MNGENTIAPIFSSATIQKTLDGLMGVVNELRKTSVLPMGIFNALNAISSGAVRGNKPYQEPIFNRHGEVYAFESLSSFVGPNGERYPVQDTADAHLEIGETRSFDLITTAAGIDSAKSNGCFSSGALVTFNIFVPSAQDKRFCQEFHQLFCEAGIDPEQIIIEILEVREDSGYIIDPNANTSYIRKLEKMGYTVAEDDIGLRPSDIERMRLFKGAIAKIDGPYIRGYLERNGFNDVEEESLDGLEQILENIKTYMPGAEIVAECVHTRDEMDFLNRKLGIDFFQGRKLTQQLALYNTCQPFFGV